MKTDEQAIRKKQLEAMTRTSDGRAEIYRLARVIRGVKPGGLMGGLFIGQMISDILKVELVAAAHQLDLDAIRASDELLESVAILAHIKSHFDAKGWQPLLQIKVDGLRNLSIEKLRIVFPEVEAAVDRVSAVTAIMEVLIPDNVRPPDGRGISSEAT